jgi:hypothetical protein
MDRIDRITSSPLRWALLEPVADTGMVYGVRLSGPWTENFAVMRLIMVVAFDMDDVDATAAVGSGLHSACAVSVCLFWGHGYSSAISASPRETIF